MTPLTFDEFFRTALGQEVIAFDYQRRLGEDPECKSRLINIPTGCGKTAAVVLAWLWNRVFVPQLNGLSARAASHWPRRLVYCLPMRTLVEQTQNEVSKWLTNLWKNADALVLNHNAKEELGWLESHSPVILMGGEETDLDWDVWPERSAILIGTQDMLLSRALNRGYAMSRYRWPMHFGLLNNDCLWVMDETQLMGVGVETSAQLDGFRHEEKIHARPRCRTWWMSATLDESQLVTVDHPKPDSGWLVIELGESDLALPAVRNRYHAKKTIVCAPTALDAAGKGEYPKLLARLIAEQHKRAPDDLTLVILNNVLRAQDVFTQLQKNRPAERIALIHSRFRSPDRKAHEEILHADGGRIVVATQAVEAGVDVSARVLITELAPWSSLVQRFGRCNRYGELTEGEIFWIDIKPRDERDDLALPYTFDELKTARELLSPLGGNASPRSLRENIDYTLPATIRPVIRRKDLFDLFDTTPDLCGNDLDISRYVRDSDDTDVHVFWREWDGPIPPCELPAARREELCPAPLGDFNEFVKDHVSKNHGAWRWDYLERKWTRADRIYPGQIYLLHASDGGYSLETGWNPKEKGKVIVLPEPPAPPPEANDDDDLSQIETWQSIAEHTDKVVGELSKILDALNSEHRSALELAARWHDLGKAHAVFQNAIKLSRDSELRPEAWRERCDIAKAPGKNKCSGDPGWWSRYERKHFRHEMASALAVLQPSIPIGEEVRDLVAYLIAAHHGKVRLSLRLMPDEDKPPNGKRFARGVWDGDKVPAESSEIDLGGGLIAKQMTISLEPMELGLCEEPPFEGQPSWAERMLHLRDTLGPFRLAFLETLLRAADQRASAMISQAS